MVDGMLAALSDALAGLLTLAYRPPAAGELVLGARRPALRPSILSNPVTVRARAEPPACVPGP